MNINGVNTFDQISPTDMKSPTAKVSPTAEVSPTNAVHPAYRVAAGPLSKGEEGGINYSTSAVDVTISRAATELSRGIK